MYLHPKTDVNYILKSEGRERERKKEETDRNWATFPTDETESSVGLL